MQNGSSTIPPRVQKSHGFCGTIRQHAESDHAWTLAIDAIATATSASEEAVRAFLASRCGRHFGDEAIGRGRDLAAAINGAVERWMDAHHPLYRDGDRLPYLTGFVLMPEALLSPPP